MPSFNFIGGREIMKLLREFHITKVKQDLFLFLLAGSFYELKNKRFIMKEINGTKEQNFNKALRNVFIGKIIIKQKFKNDII